MKIQLFKFFFAMLFGICAYGGVGGVSGGPSAAKFIQVQVCGYKEASSLCEMIQIRNHPESYFGQGPATDCVQTSGEIQDFVPCSEETKKAIPDFLKKLFNKDQNPITNMGEIGTWEN